MDAADKASELIEEREADLMSGGPAAPKEGWALIPFVGERAHYWKPQDSDGFAAIHKGERVHFWRSLCGVEGATYAGVPLLAPGNWPLCKRCKGAL